MRSCKIKLHALIGGLLLLALLSATACSTTSRLEPGETLYTGVSKFEVRPSGTGKLPGDLVSEVKGAINVAPNNPMPFLSPYVRTPFPVGLWVYNHWNDSARGLKGWLYRQLVRQPVLISDVRPEQRVKKIEDILADNGYFGSTASYTLHYDKHNRKKARVSYQVDVNTPYRIDSIQYLANDSLPVCQFIDSLARKSKYLCKGSVFCVDSLESERIRIVNRLRTKGYYYFRPEYIEFLADTFITPHHVALRLTLAGNVPRMATYAWRTGRIITDVQRRSTRRPGTPDTISTSRGEVVIWRPAHLRDSLIPSCITFRRGKLFSVRDMDRTQDRLSRLGIFSNIQIQPVPADTSATDPTLDVYVSARFDRPMEASIEVNATSKSNSYLGPGIVLGLTHHNLFGGAEKFNISLNANYEWQTGHSHSSLFNSYEIGLTASLAFPRLLAPRFVKRRNRELNWTTVTLSGDLLNRPHYFKMAEVNAGFTYDWKSTRNSSNSFTPFKLSYAKLMSTTHDFDSIMGQNPAVAQSFESRFIPQMSYTYTLDKFFEREKINGITLTATVIEAGNIFNGIWSLCGAKGERKLFGTPFSQFVKGQVQLVYNRRLIRGTEQWLVSRILVGAEHAYGNSSEVPYSEQFYIGGANSIRAFTVRSIGPGSYRAPKSQRNGYFDQTGTFKLELNCEYRFPIVSVLHGALFLDAGNIWLLKNDPLRPGGKLEMSTFFRDLALGTGVGLRVDIGMMVLRCDLGYGLHTPWADASRHYFNVPFKDAWALHLAIGYPF